MKKTLLMGACALSTLAFGTPSQANELAVSGNHHHGEYRADGHAPKGVMGDHMHEKGEWMMSYRYMRMHMEDNRNGTNDLSPEQIVTSIPNRFFGTPMQPATLRVVPTEMTTDMHMLGAMYAPTDSVTLMVMANYIKREMDHITFAGGAGTTRLGEFTTETSGWGDTRVGGLIRMYDDSKHHIHLNAGLSLPTGSIKEEDQVLTPMGTRPTMRLPYAMQLGSGTYDLMPGVTYTGRSNAYSWGAQYMATLRLGENSQDYTLGNKHEVSAWGAYSWVPSLSTSLRVSAETEGDIDGIDRRIVAPVQTANPDNFGGERIALSLGMNYVVPKGVLAGHRLSVEGTVPVYQDLNGPQMKRDNMVVLGWSKAF
ncbi:MAG: transporter [Alphaproteobacteria bacterium]|nr:transporter [Alphaproteobacteria bacterium]NCQ88953.1 transporter [Alphaproteobacteria bacterium]NCT07855.1 transporter [Alphaproteobacteria bacterium]